MGCFFSFLITDNCELDICLGWIEMADNFLQAAQSKVEEEEREKKESLVVS